MTTPDFGTEEEQGRVPDAVGVLEVATARRALRCLYLEVPASIADDVSAKIEAAFAALGVPPT